MRCERLSVDGYREVWRFHSDGSGLDAIIALHDLTLGPALGGCRMHAYESFDAALADALRLARGMTFKNAVVGIPFGGGKAVIMASPRDLRKPAILRAFGEAVDSLEGRYWTAEDVGIGFADAAEIARITPWVSGVRSGDPSPYTARGVFLGLREAVRARLKAESLAGIRVLVVGIGKVGSDLCRLLHEADATLLVSDVDGLRAAEAAELYGAEIIAPDDVLQAPADVLAPCALGGLIDDVAARTLKVAVVAGAANNQLAQDAVGTRLFRRGILYAPDYVINAGGVISVAQETLGGWTRERVLASIERIGTVCRRIFETSRSDGVATNVIADRLAQESLRAARRERRPSPSRPLAISP